MPEPIRRCFVHIGLPKTGTTYLQSILWASRKQLEAQGVTLLPHENGVARSVRLRLAVRGQLRDDIDSMQRGQVLAHLRRQLRESSGDVLISQEQFSSARPEQVARLWHQLEGFEIHLVVTARALHKRIPSSWQERVKTRSVVSLPDFIESVRDRTAPAGSFWEHHDLGAVLDRWTQALPPERVHVVTVPYSNVPDGLLLARFCSVLGVDPEALDVSRPRGNTTLGSVQTELLRRVNLALGDRLPEPRRGYSQASKSWLVPQVLGHQRSPSPVLPAEHLRWVQDLTESWNAQIEAAGFDVVGELADLSLDPADASSAPVATPTVTDEAVHAAAIEALARVLEWRSEHVRVLEANQTQIHSLKAEVARLEKTSTGPAHEPLRRRLPRLGGRILRRLRS